MNKEYNTFLKSSYWKKVRKLVLTRDNYECQNCKQIGRICNLTVKDLEVHHLTYKNHKNELHHLDDLTTLCKSCHEYMHQPNDWDQMVEAEFLRLMENPNS